MVFYESSSSESDERPGSPNPLFAALMTGLARRSESEGEYSESEESELSEYSPGKDQAMIDSLYPVLQIPRGSPELGLPTSPALQYKSTVELCAKEPGEESSSDDSRIYDPRISASPQPRPTEIPETPPESSDPGSEEELDDSDDGWNGSASDSTVGPACVNGRRRFRPDWYHPHTRKALQFFNNSQEKWPDLVYEYEAWAGKALTALQLAYLKPFALGTLDQHREASQSKYWREGDRKAFGIIAHCMEKGVHRLTAAADQTAFDEAPPTWVMREWAVAGRKALQSKGKEPTLIRTMSGRLPRVEMTSKELLQAARGYSKDPSMVSRLEGGALDESVSPRTVLPTPDSLVPPPTGLPVPSANTSASHPADTITPDPVSAPSTAAGNETAASGSAVPAPAPSASLPAAETAASGPVFFPSSSAPGPSSCPTVNLPDVKTYTALEPDPVELYQQWCRFFSSNVLDNGGNVKSFSESLDIQVADVSIYGDRFAIPLWVKKLQFLEGLPDQFSEVKADFIRRRGGLMLLDDPEFDYAGRLTHGNTQAITWKALVGHFDVKEVELENARRRAEEEERNRLDYEREEQFAQQQAAKQLKQEAARREEREKKEKEDQRMRTVLGPHFQDWKKGTLDSSESAAAASTSQAPLMRKGKVPSPPNEPNAPLRTPFYQFVSNRRRANPRKNAIPAKGVLKHSPPTATTATASSSDSSDSSASSSAKSKLKPKKKKAEKPELARCSEPAQFSKAAQKGKKNYVSSGPSAEADEVEQPSSHGDRAMEVDIPSTPINKHTWSFKPGPPITSSGNPSKSSAGSKVVSSKAVQYNDSGDDITEKELFSGVAGISTKSGPSGTSGVDTKPAEFNESGEASPMSGIESNAFQRDQSSAPDGINSRSGEDVTKPGPSTDSRKATTKGNKDSESDAPSATNDKSTPDVPTTKSNSSRVSAANVKSVRAPSSSKPQPASTSDAQANQPDPAAPSVRKTLIDPARIDVDPRTLPAYCNLCKVIGHTGNTKRCPRYTPPTAGRIIGNENRRGPVPGKAEKERLLKEQEEAVECQKKQKAKEERKAERAARKDRERAERERLEKEKLEKESAGQEQREKETVGEQANAQKGGTKEATTASSTPAEGKGKKKKKPKAKAVELEKSNAQDPDDAPEPEVKVKQEPVSPQAPKALAAPAAASSSTASAGTKRNIDEVEEAGVPIDKEERKRRKKERRQKMRQEKRQAKLRQEDLQAGK